MKVLFLTTWETACGIATYSSNLVEHLEKLGVRVEIFSETKNFNSIVRLAKDTDADIVHIQQEFGISPPTEALLSLMGKFKSTGRPVVITTHAEDSVFNVLLDGVADAVVLHNDVKNLSEKNTFSRFYRIPHGIPEITFDQPKREYRKKYGIPEKAFVIGTCGFMSPDRGKFIEEFIGDLLTFIKDNQEVYVHIATSSHRADTDGGFAKMIRSSLSNMAQQHNFADRFYIHSEFMDTGEFRERLYTFDVGFAHTSAKVFSNSGAAADMVSCGVPVIVNDVPHFSHIKPYIVAKHDIHEMVNEVINIHKKGPLYLSTLQKKALEAPKKIGYSKMAEKHKEIYESLIQEKRAIAGGRSEKKLSTKKLSKDTFITITCPNSLWQIMLLWQKLKKLSEDGHRFRFVVQNDGLMETGILPFVFDGISDVQYADIGMTDDPRVARVHSRSLAQNMTTDVERWLMDGKSLCDLFPFLASDPVPAKANLGEFATKRAAELTPDTEDLCEVNVGDEDMLMRAPTILQKLAREDSVVFKRLLIMGKPMTEKYTRALYEKVAGSVFNGADVAIEDTRTRWALCHRAHTVITGWGDVAAYCLINRLNAVYDCKNHWQYKLVKEFGDNFLALKDRVKDTPVPETTG